MLVYYSNQGNNFYLWKRNEFPKVKKKVRIMEEYREFNEGAGFRFRSPRQRPGVRRVRPTAWASAPSLLFVSFPLALFRFLFLFFFFLFSFLFIMHLLNLFYDLKGEKRTGNVLVMPIYGGETVLCWKCGWMKFVRDKLEIKLELFCFV